MSQFVGRHVAPEMLALGLLELLLTFTLAYIFLAPAGPGLAIPIVNQALLFAVIVGFTAFTVGLYRPQMFQRSRGLILNTILSALLSFPLIWIVSKLSGLNTLIPVGYDSLRPVKIVATWCIALVALRLLFLAATRWNLFVHRVAIVGSGESPSVTAALRASRRGFLEIALMRPERASTARLTRSRVRTLVVCQDVAAEALPVGIDEYRRRGVKVADETRFWEDSLRRVNVARIDHVWLAELSNRPVKRSTVVIGRAFDVATSLMLLIGTLPIMFVVAVLVRFDSPGSILYRQERLGLEGRPFTVLKFRSMRANAEASGPKWAQQRDPRVTRVGSFMRKTRIDELPQLINILRGEMSFIGPRPERRHFADQLAAEIPFYHERSRVKPGLTGWAQVNYPYGASVEDARAKLSYDLYYVKNRSLMLDLLILVSTVRVILFQEGAR